MTILICYDVNTEDNKGRARLRRIATLCKNHGVRVQYSVFECLVDDIQWIRLRSEVLSTIDRNEDSVRFYFIDERAVQRTEHHGVRLPIDIKEPLVI
jgi:CRISPR-associated protein Cas2